MRTGLFTLLIVAVNQAPAASLNSHRSLSWKLDGTTLELRLTPQGRVSFVSPGHSCRAPGPCSADADSYTA